MVWNAHFKHGILELIVTHVIESLKPTIINESEKTFLPYSCFLSI